MTSDHGVEKDSGAGDNEAQRSASRRARWRRVRNGAALALVAFSLVASVLAVRAERAVRRSSEGRVFALSEAPARPVVIVLGARVSPAGRPFAALEDWLLCALDLVRSGRAEYELVSGDYGRVNYDEAARVKAVLDTDVLRTKPRYWGERIPIGERRSDATHDARTAAQRASDDDARANSLHGETGRATRTAPSAG